MHHLSQSRTGFTSHGLGENVCSIRKTSGSTEGCSSLFDHRRENGISGSERLHIDLSSRKTGYVGRGDELGML